MLYLRIGACLILFSTKWGDDLSSAGIRFTGNDNPGMWYGWLSWRGTPFLIFSAKRDPAAIVTRRRRVRYPSDKTFLQSRGGKAESASAAGIRCDLRSIWIISGISLTHLGKYVWDDLVCTRVHIYTMSNRSHSVNLSETKSPCNFIFDAIKSINRIHSTKFFTLVHKRFHPVSNFHRWLAPLQASSPPLMILYLTKC